MYKKKWLYCDVVFLLYLLDIFNLILIEIYEINFMLVLFFRVIFNVFVIKMCIVVEKEMYIMEKCCYIVVEFFLILIFWMKLNFKVYYGFLIVFVFIVLIGL